ncbi:unnamed protein product [Arctia plantaginis]|uniref:Reverse transcriptase domain-containing protein n=1 Tax=Arctia plantaginis TaxID=874455 RepID=A0A8S1AUG8_ARCPL|nr:unnamed protein product [Arctia plantaginis]
MRCTSDGWGGGITIGGRKICNLRYAGDTTLLAATGAEMTTYLDKMKRISTELGISINRSKTKILVIDRPGKLELTGNFDLEVVDNFVYPGASISSNRPCESEIRRRRRNFRIWRD